MVGLFIKSKVFITRTNFLIGSFSIKETEFLYIFSHYNS